MSSKIITVELGPRDRETIRSAVKMMAGQARCGGGFDGDDWEDVKRVLAMVGEEE